MWIKKKGYLFTKKLFWESKMALLWHRHKNRPHIFKSVLFFL